MLSEWHGLTVIITTLTGVPERELDDLLANWREARPEERQAAVAAMRIASYQGVLTPSQDKRGSKAQTTRLCTRNASDVARLGCLLLA